VKLTDSIGSFVVAMTLIAILYVLVRPGSPGVGYVKTVGTALAHLVQATTGQNTGNAS